LGLGQHDVVVAVMPGSRRGEVRHIAPAFVRAAQRLKAARPELRCVLPAAPGLRPMVEAIVAEAGAHDALQIVDGHSHEALAASDVVLVASGTATLEAALFKRPMVIGYRMAWLSWQIMNRMRYQPWVGLPNVLCEDFVVPELLQDAMTPEALAAGVLRWLDDPAACDEVAQRFHQLHLLLRRDTARTASDAIAQILEG
jgi:lipid-A-disaccharide synthase